MSNRTKTPPFDRPLSAKALAVMPDETIDYTDIPELDDAFFEGAIERPAPQKRVVSLRLDEETIAVFKELSPKGYTSTMAQVLQKAAAKLRSI